MATISMSVLFIIHLAVRTLFNNIDLRIKLFLRVRTEMLGQPVKRNDSVWISGKALCF